MYIPKHFRQKDWEEIQRFITEFPFAILASMKDLFPVATHIPIELETNFEGEKVLWGHMARGNRQWRGFGAHPEVLVIFQSYNSYVSSSWYEDPEVPTWNYQAVHISGRVKELSAEALKESLRRQLSRYEQDSECPVSMETLPESIVEPQLKGIFGFEITIDKIEANYKLSQNRNERDYDNVIHELWKKEDEQSRGIAEAMRRIKAE